MLNRCNKPAFKKGFFSLSLCGALALALSGCMTDAGPTAFSSSTGNTSTLGASEAKPALATMTPLDDAKAATTIAAHTENVTIQSPDGTSIAMTVFYPALKPGQVVPLLLHSHGFGGNRVQSLDFDQATQTSEIGQDAMQIAYNQKNPVADRPGWYVISYDQRGHGDTGSVVYFMDPTKEGADFKAVLDWAQTNLTHLGFRQKDGKPNPVVGTIGRSYGGGFQLMGAGIDDRVDAMIPGGTWYDLRYSLDPNGVPKTAYMDGLIAGGAQSNKGRFAPFIYQTVAESNTTGDVDPAILEHAANLSSISYCDPSQNLNSGMTLKSVPALFIQGEKDILFNINEGIDNFKCYRKVNQNSKLILTKYGHTLNALYMQKDPAADLAGTGAKYAFHESLIWLKTKPQNCPASIYDASTGRCVIPLKDMMFQFLVQNLIGQQQANSADYLGFDPVPLPDVTAVLEDGRADPTAIDLKTDASGTPDLGGTGPASSFTTPTQVFTGLTGIPSGLSSTQAPAQLAQPIYVPLSNSPTPGCYVGTPTATVKVESPAPVDPSAFPDKPIIFVGLGIKRADGTEEVLHDQVTPVKGYGTFNIDLAGISVQLNEGDKLDLNIEGYNPIFVNSFNRVPQPVNVSASVKLPTKVADTSGLCTQ